MVELVPETYEPFRDGDVFLETLRGHQTDDVTQQQIEILHDQIRVAKGTGRGDVIVGGGVLFSFICVVWWAIYILDRRLKKLQASISRLDAADGGKSEVGSQV